MYTFHKYKHTHVFNIMSVLFLFKLFYVLLKQSFQLLAPICYYFKKEDNHSPFYSVLVQNKMIKLIVLTFILMSKQVCYFFSCQITSVFVPFMSVTLTL